jgi:NADH:ubiquinone oxidoreductase subunit F (NADH-binding)
MEGTLTKKLLTERFFKIDPMDIEDYIAYDGYFALKKALLMAPEEIISAVKSSGLRGRGGAAFPMGIKMEAVFMAQASEKFLICNADEGEPGNFKDRYLMENDPHQLIEGMVICAYTVGAQKGYLFVRGEYTKAFNILTVALETAYGKGYLGRNILGSGFDFDIELYPGAGSYVSGEEFALMVCIEGNPARSTYKPPFPTSEGLFNKPTQINNVETFSNIPHIIQNGPEAFAKIGTESSKGTKLVSLSGNVQNKGLYEVPFGITIRDIIEKLGGGVPDGRKVKLVQLGGASGPCIPASLLDLRLDYKDMAAQELTFGSGAVIVMDERADVLDILKRTLEFFNHESCGKCTPCREGILHMLIILERFIQNNATEDDLKLLKTLISTIGLTSICGLGQAAPTAVNSALKYFREEFTSKINKHFQRTALGGYYESY